LQATATLTLKETAMPRITIQIEAETSAADATYIVRDAVTIVETTFGYIFDNVIVTSSLEDEDR
jgi:hypothetical protein